VERIKGFFPLKGGTFGRLEGRNIAAFEALVLPGLPLRPPIRVDLLEEE
jgi:hypothetical protein